MKDFRSIIFCAAALSSLAVVGCNSSDNNNNNNNGVDGGTGSDASTDARIRPDRTAPPPPYEFTTDKTPFASAAEARTAQNAGFTQIAAQCECLVTAEGFEDEESCTNAFAPDENVIENGCYDTHYATASEALRGGISCYWRLTAGQAACIDASTCDETTFQCFQAGDGEDPTAYDAAIQTCISDVEQTELTTFFNTIETCVLDGTIGDAADTCATGDAVTTIGEAVFSGTTLGKGDHRKPPESCLPFLTMDDVTYGDLRAPDVTHRWKAPAAGTYTFSSAGSMYDTVLYVIADDEDICAAPTPTTLACNDDPDGGAFGTVTLSLAMGESVQIVIDGYGNPDVSDIGGEYTISITQDSVAPAGDAGVPDASAPDAS